MKVIGVTGPTGRVGQELLQFPNVVPLVGDVTMKPEIARAVENNQVDIIVHLASISDVDRCEDKRNQRLVDSVNVRGTFNVAEVAEDFGCEMVLLSTIHIFDGERGNYGETARPNPKNYYGLTKLAAEGFQQVFKFLKVVRTSYLFDYDRLFRHIYPLRSGESYEYPTFIDRSFLYLPHFAEIFYAYLLRYESMPKVLNISGSMVASWFDFMRELSLAYKIKDSFVRPRDYEIQMNVAPRPYRGGLDVKLSMNLGLPQYNYLEGLQEMRNASR